MKQNSQIRYCVKGFWRKQGQIHVIKHISLESVDNVRYIWTLVQIITQFVIGVTFPLATTYDPALNGEPLTGFHSTWQTVLKIWTRLFWIGQDKAIEVAIYTHKKKHRNLTGTKVWANDTFLFLWLTVWPEYQAFLGEKGKMEAKKGEISSPLAP